MRSLLTPLAALAACAALLELAPAPPAPAAAAKQRRTWQMALSPAVGELALAQLDFTHAAHGARLGAGALSVSASAPFGDDYLLTGVLRLAGSRLQRALVLVANRASPLADPAHVRLRASAAIALGSPSVLRASDPFSHAQAKVPGLCDLPLHGRALEPAQLLLVGSRGAPLSGIGPAAALADAYDALCGLPYPSTFKQDIASAGTTPSPPGSTSPTPTPTPSPPTEPAPPPGGCEPCTPRPGTACPLARQAVCVSEPRAVRGADAH